MTSFSLWEAGVVAGQAQGERPMSRWEYLIDSLLEIQATTHAPGSSEAIHSLNEEGDRGWEAVTMPNLANGSVAALFKRPVGVR